MAIQFKKKCIRCKKNYVLATRRSRALVCYDCQKKDMDGQITDPKMKKLLDIPEEYYKHNSFLRNIKISYLRYGSLTDKQIEAFEKSVEKTKKALDDS